jgi:hypothetical protein
MFPDDFKAAKDKFEEAAQKFRASQSNFISIRVPKIMWYEWNEVVNAT